jgi:hypothetical protein
MHRAQSGNCERMASNPASDTGRLAKLHAKPNLCGFQQEWRPYKVLTYFSVIQFSNAYKFLILAPLGQFFTFKTER